MGNLETSGEPLIVQPTTGRKDTHSRFKSGACPTLGEMDVNEGLSTLELLVLRAIPHSKNIEDLSKLAKVSPAALGQTVAKLQMEGYIAYNGGLTEKGKDAIGK